jgi:hypothetical protein
MFQPDFGAVENEMAESGIVGGCQPQMRYPSGASIALVYPFDEILPGPMILEIESVFLFSCEDRSICRIWPPGQDLVNRRFVARAFVAVPAISLLIVARDVVNQ